jgi:hypothetical protein
MAIKHYLPPPEEYTPPCSGNVLFTDPPDRATARKLARICQRSCECRNECAQEAEAIRKVTVGRNLWGVWAGRVYQMENRASA